VSVSSLLFSPPDHRHSFSIFISFVCRYILWTGPHFSLLSVSAGVSGRGKSLDLTLACQI
jgi:hypothetical protein